MESKKKSETGISYKKVPKGNKIIIKTPKIHF